MPHHPPSPAPRKHAHIGIGSPAANRKAIRNLEEAGSAKKAKPGSYPRFRDAPLEPIDHVVATDETHFIPSTHHITCSTTRRTCDEDGKPIVWPWETQQQQRHHSVYDHTPVSASPTARPVRAWHPLDRLVNAGLDQASRDGKRGRTHTGVKAWFAFTEDEMHTQAERPLDPNAPLWVKLEEEWLCMRFVCALVEERGVSVESARVYFSSVQGWHAREHGIKLAGGLKLERLPQMLKGLRRIIGEQPRAVRRGIAPQMLKKAFDIMLNPANPVHANVRAALATALQGLLRSKEYTNQDRRLMLTRSDVVQLDSKQMVIMMHPCKNMHHLGGKTCPLVIGSGGEYIDAVWEVQNLLRVDPHRAADANTTPLFRDPATNQPLSYTTIYETTRQLMVAICENPDHFGTHSYRIGGATALFSAGANETVIRTMGRWSSDLHRLYVRACYEQCVEWSRRAGSAQVSELSGDFDEVDYY